MNDWPTQPSTLMCVSFRVTRTGAALNVFLSTVTVDTVPGFGWISMVPDSGNDSAGAKTGPVAGKLRPPTETPAWPIRRTCPSSMPQPIWYPASNVPPLSDVFPPPVTVPVNVPPTRYSRDETAVVSGATGNWVSSFATTVSVHPSGLVTMPGSADGTTPLSGGGPGSSAGSIGGSADARGEVAAKVRAMQAAATAAKRFIVFSRSRSAGVRRTW